MRYRNFFLPFRRFSMQLSTWSKGNKICMNFIPLPHPERNNFVFRHATRGSGLYFFLQFYVHLLRMTPCQIILHISPCYWVMLFRVIKMKYRDPKMEAYFNSLPSEVRAYINLSKADISSLGSLMLIGEHFRYSFGSEKPGSFTS